MKKILFATTATTALLLGGMASAQGISLFGSARLGLLYDDDAADSTANSGSKVTTTSRIRFGVNMTGETDSGITFGASIRADNSANGLNEGKAGSAFVSGNWGTVTFGDTAGADENWVGDVPGNLSLTGLSDENETPFFSNGGGFDNEDSLQFANNPNARPTMRYDYDFAGFGISLSTDHTLRDLTVGAGWAGNFGNMDAAVGIGYNAFGSFETAPSDPELTCIDADDDGVCETVTIGATPGEEFNKGEQFSVSGSLGYNNYSLGVVYSNAKLKQGSDAKLETIAVGGTAGFDAFTVGAYYSTLLTLKDNDGNKVSEANDTIGDGSSSYGVTASYDLGGGASVNGGVVQTYNDNTRGDFGIKMAF
jgi:outer membrane protein OmpU